MVLIKTEIILLPIPVFQAEKDYFLVTIEEADGPPKLVVLAKKKTTNASS